MSTHNVQIFVDCEAIINNRNISAREAIYMYAKPAIVTGDQGGSELSIKVPTEDIIEWRTYPLVVNKEGAEKVTYDVVVDVRYAWGNAQLIKDWTAHQGDHTVHVYEQDDLPMNQNAEVALKAKGAYQPFVRGTAKYPGERPDPDPVGREEAYTFSINIYENGALVVSEWRWDPYVTVYVPVS